MGRVRIIAAFAGTGKTTFAHNNPTSTVDLDSSAFAKAAFPRNYVKEIHSQFHKLSARLQAGETTEDQFILISTHDEVIRHLSRKGHDVELVYPHRSLKYEYIHRYQRRGSTGKAISYISKNWNKFITQLHMSKTHTRHQLKAGQYLEDILTTHPALDAGPL